MASEELVAQLLGKHLGVDFRTAKRSLDGWGQADRCVELRKNVWLLLEIEGKQHHPNTNVLKLWPFLEKQETLSVVLVHAFENAGKNRVSSRGRLADWLALKMKKLLGSRFRYHRVIIDTASGEIEGTDSLMSLIKKFSQSRTSRSNRSRAKTRAPV